MPRIVVSAIFGWFLLLVMNSRIAMADSFYCELSFDDSIPPVSFKLDIFADGSVSAVLDDKSVWIQKEKESILSSTEVFYQFQLEPKSPSERDSFLKIYLSRFSLKLHARREDRSKGKVVSVTEYNNMQCRERAVIELFPNGT